MIRIDLLAQQAPPGSWAEYGLAGLVILALFTAIGFLIRWLVKHMDDRAAAHRNERLQWTEKTEKVMSELTDVIKEVKIILDERYRGD